MKPDYPLLSTIDSPADLKSLATKQLQQLAAEISELIRTVVQETGGHYSSPLGVVDLTLALHYVFDSPTDKLIWDVGHQAYAHKIITGRRDQFHTLRIKDGISGFLRRSESEHDVFGAGHASTAISAGTGIAESNKMSGNDQSHVVAIVGDGALTGGLAFEGLNNLGYTKLKMTVVLNDNSMSISPTVGSLSTYLTHVITNPLYNRIRDDIWKATGLLPLGTAAVRKFFRRLEEGLKSFLTPGLLFDELGLRYFGPINGHDYDSMIKVFRNVKELPYPTMVHVLTRKGRGQKEAEADSQQYYSVAGRRKRPDTASAAPDFNQVFGQVAIELARANDSVCCITAAMEVGTGLTEYAKLFPERYYDVGLAEEHAVTFAGGLATEGRRPIVAIYSTFLQRAFDQILHDIALQNLPVIFCLDRSGLVGPDGPTHHGVFDMAILRTIPGVVLCAPRDGNELRDLMFSALKYQQPVIIRYPKDNSIEFDPHRAASFISSGSWELLREGADAAILAVGSMVPVALAAAVVLEAEYEVQAAVINARFVKPLDAGLLRELAQRGTPIVTVEEGQLAGGFGSAVREQLAADQMETAVIALGIADDFTEHGTRQELLELVGLTADNVVAKVLGVLQAASETA